MNGKKVTSIEIQKLAELRNQSGAQIHAGLQSETNSERELLTTIVCYIFEVYRRQLYLNYNYPSLFDYLVKEMKYSNGSAQRRLDAAILLGESPELLASLASGELTLTQVSVVAQGLKQVKREARKLNVSQVEGSCSVETAKPITSTVEVKRNLLNMVKSQSTANAQQIVAQALNLEIKAVERKVVQRDESLRLEVTFTKEEAQLLKQVKDILSHSHPGATCKEIIVAALQEIKKRKDPDRKIRINAKRKASDEVASPSALDVNEFAKSSGGESFSFPANKNGLVITSAAEVRRSIFRRDKTCQWKYDNGQVCGSTFQLQVDHKKSRWLGGSDQQSNFQLLCSAHNRLKYQLEVGERYAGQR